MSRKVQAWTRKKLHRQRARELREAAADRKAQRQEEKRLDRGAQTIDAALKGCRDAAHLG